MGELLDFNVKLSDLQNQYSTVFEGTSEKKRNLDNMEERKIEKRYKSICSFSIISNNLSYVRLLLLNIKLAISNMYKYAMRRKVSLPGDDDVDVDQVVSSVSVPGNFN